jgi:large subunit ribosomal protein L3
LWLLQNAEGNSSGSVEEYEIGQKLTVEMFTPARRFASPAPPKGTRFRGCHPPLELRRRPATHGHEQVHRKPGSIGQCAWPSKVFKGMKLPGQSANKTATMLNIEIVDVRPEDNVVTGARPDPGTQAGDRRPQQDELG